MKEAKYYEARSEGKVICQLCPYNCVIEPGKTGICKSRKNIEGKLYTLNYGKAVSVNPYDPVEKKPLYHFLPGERILSMGTLYCNLHCNYCQNYEISQQNAPVMDVTIEMIDKLLGKYELHSVAYTYTEPVIWYEFVYDTARYLSNRGIKTVMVTNGYINQEPLQALLPYLSAMNIDLKSIRNEFYDRNCGGSLSPILETIKTAAKHCHIELTNLIITEENDSDKDIAELIDFVASVDKRIPLHFSRYYPCYKLKNPPTDPQRLHYAYELARSRLHHVYVGNLPFNNALICENCHRNLGKRGYGEKLNLKDGKCSYCGHRNYGIWQT